MSEATPSSTAVPALASAVAASHLVSTMSEQQQQQQHECGRQREANRPHHRQHNHHHHNRHPQQECDPSSTQSPTRGPKQRRNHRRKNKDALKQPATRDMPRVLSEMLKEPKQALLHRVVRHIGPKHAWQLLKEALRLEREGGQPVNALGSGNPNKFLVVDEQSHELKARRRTTGGVYLALLKEQVPRDTYRSIYEIEDKKKKEAKKRMRNRSRRQMEKTLDKLGFDDLSLAAAGAQADQQADGSEIVAAAPTDDAMEDGEV